MADTTWYCNKDARIADNGSNLGAGASDYLPVGLYSGYKYRSLLGFSYSFSGMVAITNAVLHIKTSSQFYVAFGSDPDVVVRRITASWSEGSSVGLSGSNAVHWGNQPSSTASNEATFDVSVAQNTWDTVNITALLQDAKAAGVFYGLRLAAVDEGAASDVTEFYAREFGSNDAYIVVTYTTNVIPNAPVSLAPTGGSIPNGGLTPTISFTHSDNDSDPLLDYDLQVSTDSTFASVTHWNIAAQTTGIVGNDVDRVYAGTALTRGSTYYWRARTSASSGELGEGAWTAAQSFVVSSLPTATLTEPSATGRLMRTTFVAGGGWASPRPYVTWGFSCPDGGSQASWEVDIANDSAGSPGSSAYASGVVAGTDSSVTPAITLTESNYYHVRVRGVCSHGETSAYSGYFRVRARWGVETHRFDCGSAPTSWSISTLQTTTLSTNAVVMEYSSNTTTSTPGTFYDSLAAAPFNRYFFYKAWLLSWGASPATSASLDKMVLSYSANVLIPDKWTLSSANMTVDEATYVYGTQSLKFTGDGSTHTAKQTVSVIPNTNYILSGRLKILSSPDITFRIESTTGTILALYSPANGTADWARWDSGIVNSGALTEVVINIRGVGSAPGAAWVDALKFEASNVVTPWSPSFLGNAVVLDAGGLQVDATNGGILRLRGSTGGTRDRVDLGANGLKFGGETALEISSPAAKTLKLGTTDTLLRTGGTAFPGSPASGDIFWRSDLRMDCFYDGTRWLSKDLMTYQITSLRMVIPFTSNQSVNASWPRADGGDIYIEDVWCDTYVATTNSGSAYWTINFNGILSLSTISNSPNVVVREQSAVDAVHNNGSSWMQADFAKVSTPGNIYGTVSFTYRWVLT